MICDIWDMGHITFRGGFATYETWDMGQVTFRVATIGTWLSDGLQACIEAECGSPYLKYSIYIASKQWVKDRKIGEYLEGMLTLDDEGLSRVLYDNFPFSSSEIPKCPNVELNRSVDDILSSSVGKACQR